MSSSVPWQPLNSNDTNRVYIIAEIGVNHDGEFEKAASLVRVAKNAGADAVKFQFFNADRLVSDDAPTCKYQESENQSTQTQRELLKRLELTLDQFAQLKKIADDVEIDFIVTPFGITELRALAETIDVAAIKIASPDLVNIPLIDAAIALHRPLIISTGASIESEIDATVDYLQENDAKSRTALLHCVSAYPTPLDAAQLGMIRRIRDRHDLPIGFSDHTVDLETGAYAVCAGATILERHITYDRRAKGPDHAASTEPAEFAAYVSSARRAAAWMTDQPRECSDIEIEVRKLSRGRIVAGREINMGRYITADDLMVQRPGDGISPTQWNRLIGTRASRNIEAGTPLDWSMVSDTPAAV